VVLVALLLEIAALVQLHDVPLRRRGFVVRVQLDQVWVPQVFEDADLAIESLVRGMSERP
jgi:hypothetical protein